MSDWEYGVQHVGEDGQLDILAVEGDYFDQLDEVCAKLGCYRVRRHAPVAAGAWESVTTRESARLGEADA